MTGVFVELDEVEIGLDLCVVADVVAVGFAVPGVVVYHVAVSCGDPLFDVYLSQTRVDPVEEYVVADDSSYWLQIGADFVLPHPSNQHLDPH